MERSLLSCARSPKCHWVIEWSPSGKGASPPSVEGTVTQSYFISVLGLVSREQSYFSHPLFWALSKNTHANSGATQMEVICCEGRCDQMQLLLSLTLVGLPGYKGKHSRRNHSAFAVALSASAGKWIHVICSLPEGTELLMAGLSTLVGPFNSISALSQPIQLLLLIAFFHFCLCAS